MVEKKDSILFCRDFVELVADDLLDSEPPRRVLIERFFDLPLAAVMRDAWGEHVEIVSVIGGDGVDGYLDGIDLATVDRSTLREKTMGRLGCERGDRLLDRFDLVVSFRLRRYAGNILEGLSSFGTAVALLIWWGRLDELCRGSSRDPQSVWLTEIDWGMKRWCWATWRSNFEGSTTLRWTKAERAKRSLSR